MREKDNWGYCVIILLFYIFTFAQSYGFNPIPLNKFQFFYCMSFLCLISMVFLVKSLKLGKVVIDISKIDIILFVLIIYYILNYISNIPRELTMELIFLVILYLVLKQLTIRQITSILFFIPLGAVYKIIEFLIKDNYFLYGNGERLHGLFVNSTLWGGWVAISLVICFCFLLYGRKRIYFNIVTFLCIMLLLWALIVSNSRSAWLSFILAFVFIIKNYLNKFDLFRKIYKYKFFLFFILSIALSCLIFVLYKYKPDSADGRLLIWKVSIEMIKRKPLLGWGVNGFMKNYMNFQLDYFQKNPTDSLAYLADNNGYVFNEYLRILIEFGIIGLVLYGLVFIQLFKVMFLTLKNKVVNFLNITSIANVILIMAFAFFSYPTNSFHFNVALCCFLVVISKKEVTWGKKLEINYKIKYFIYLSYSVFIVLFLSYTFNYSKATNKWFKIMSSPVSEESVLLLNDLEPVLKTDPHFLYTYGLYLSKERRFDDALHVLNRSLSKNASYYTVLEMGQCYSELGNDNEAIECYKKCHYMIPNRFIPEYRLLKLYYERGQLRESLALSKELLEKPIKVNSKEIVRIRAYAHKIYNELNHQVPLN